MAISTQTQNLNLIPGKSVPVVVHLSQGNVGNTVQFYLYDGDNPYYPTNVSIAVHGVRADGSVFGPYPVSVTSGSNLVSFKIVSAMTSVNGAAIGELVLTDSNQNQIGTANFGMLVEAAPYSSSVTYEDDLSIYQRILAYVQSIPASLNGQIAIVNDRINGQIAIVNDRINGQIAIVNDRIDNIIAPPGGAPSAEEVIDARLGADGITYESLGTAIRTQVEELNAHFQTRTDNIFDIRNCKVVKMYVDRSSGTVTIRSHPRCASVLIPVDSNKGSTISIIKLRKSRFMWVALPTNDVDSISTGYDVTNYPRGINDDGYDITVSINSTTKGIFLWYYFEDLDSYTEEDIRHSIMVKYGSGKYYEPSYGAAGYNHILTPFGIGDSRDFDSPSYALRNCSVYLTSSDSELLMNTPIGSNETGAWVLKNELFRDIPYASIWSLQTAFSFHNSHIAANSDNVIVYQRYRLYNVSDGTFEDSIVTKWRRINSIIDEINSYSPYKWSQYSNPTGNTAWYITDYTYPKGTVKNVKVNISGNVDQTGYIFFVNPYDGTIMERIDFTGHGETYIDVNKYFGNDFYLGIHCDKSYFKSGIYQVSNGVMYTRYISGAAELSEHSKIDLSLFNAEGTTSYCLAQRITYVSIKEEAISKGYSRSHNSLYVIGDSITAGHDSYVIGNHWWEAIAREYRYDVKLGARTGAGMSYWNGVNACKIVTEQDLSKYDVVLIAFGTNDYGHDQPIGTMDDTYVYSEDSSQTFYAATNYVVRKIKEKNPLATIIFSLPINRTTAFGGAAGSIDTKWAYGYSNSEGHTLNDYCEAIVNVCNRYGLPYIDHRNGAYDVYAVQSLLYDGLHPSVDGYKVLGCEMVARFGAIIRPYPEYDGSGGPDVEHNQY